MRVSTIVLSAGMVMFAASEARVDPILFINDYEGFVEAARDVQTIDFETLPDGTPTLGGEQIAPEFNYTDQGVTFSPHLDIGEPPLHISGNSITGFRLKADSYPSFERNWLIADLVVPAYALGIFFPSSTTLSVFDTNDFLIASASYGPSGSGNFMGIVSDVPIVSAVGDNGSYSQSFESFRFTPVPEPGTLGLLALGAVALMRCGRRGKRA